MGEKERERERQAREKQNFGDMSMGKGGSVLARQKTPPPEVLVSYFDETAEDLELTEDDLKIREIARSMDISIPDVEKVQCVFKKYDADGSGQMEKDEFEEMMTELICVGRLKGLTVPQGLLDDQWRSVDHDGSGEVEFEEFAEWYLLSYIPMQQKNEERAAYWREQKKQIRKRTSSCVS